MKFSIKKQILYNVLKMHSHTDEIKLQITKKGIHIKTVDPSHIELVITQIKPQAFEEYKVDQDKLELCIDIDKPIDFLKIGKKNDVFYFMYDAKENKLIARVGNLTRTMGLLYTDRVQETPIPSLTFNSSFTVNSQIFYKKLKATMYRKKDYSKYKPRKNIIMLKKETVEFQSYNEVTNKIGELGEFVHDVKTMNAKGYFVAFDSDLAVKQCNQFRKLVNELEVHMNDYSHPMMIKGKNDYLRVEYYIAPCIDKTLEEHHATAFEYQRQQYLKQEQTKKENTEVEPDPEPEPVVPEPVEPLIIVSKKIEHNTEYNDRLSTCKPKQKNYNKNQWTYAMDAIKQEIKKFFSHEKSGVFVEITRYKAFVFFAVDPCAEFEVDKDQAENIIENLLPDRMVLIAWYQVKPDYWVAQVVEKAG